MAAKMGKMNVEKVKTETFSNQRGNFAKYFKYQKGNNFVRMLPPVEGQDFPWMPSKKHFSLTDSMKGVGGCTFNPKTCFVCKQVSKDLNSPKKKIREIADKRKVSSGYAFQMIDVTPLYTKKKKDEFVADNPPPDCWGEVKIDEEGDFVGKCLKCSWNQSCSRGVQIGNLSGQRIDDVATCAAGGIDISDLKEGRNIRIKRKGEGFGTSYTIYCDEDLAWTVPKKMRKFISENFIDLCEVVRPATPQETEESWYGKSEDVDMPSCYGEYGEENKKKCKKCEYADICKEEKAIEKESNDNDNDDDNNDDKKRLKEIL